MGWTDSHLHSFEIGKKTYTNAHEDLDELRMLPEAKEVLGDLLGTTIQHFVYEYDFGDSEAIENPAHSEHESMLTWVGGAFDPEGFDLNTINRTLRIGPHPAYVRKPRR